MVVSNQRADLNEVWNRDLCAVEVESTKIDLSAQFEVTEIRRGDAYWLIRDLLLPCPAFS